MLLSPLQSLLASPPHTGLPPQDFSHSPPEDTVFRGTRFHHISARMPRPHSSTASSQTAQCGAMANASKLQASCPAGGKERVRITARENKPEGGPHKPMPGETDRTYDLISLPRSLLGSLLTQSLKQRLGSPQTPGLSPHRFQKRWESQRGGEELSQLEGWTLQETFSGLQALTHSLPTGSCLRN